MKRREAREANEFNMGEWRMNGKMVYGESSRFVDE